MSRHGERDRAAVIDDRRDWIRSSARRRLRKGELVALLRIDQSIGTSLREKSERRLVSRIFTSWNHIAAWLRGLQALKAVA